MGIPSQYQQPPNQYQVQPYQYQYLAMFGQYSQPISLHTIF